jgi:hypothetical protein
MTDKQSLAEMRKELRILRKEHVKPVSRLRKSDIASELERLRDKRESVPPVASTVGMKAKKTEAKIADIKVAKEHDFPVKPAEESKKKVSSKSSKKATVVGGSGAVDVEPKMSKKALLMKMLDSMSDSE